MLGGRVDFDRFSMNTVCLRLSESLPKLLLSSSCSVKNFRRVRGVSGSVHNASPRERCRVHDTSFQLHFKLDAAIRSREELYKKP